MRLLKNFTIRIVMLAILGLFCLLWSGVGLFSLHSLSKISEGNDIDRHLVHQMTVLSQGNDQYFRFVTRLSRAMDVKMSGGTPDFAPAQQSLENMSKTPGDENIVSSPMDPEVAAAVLTKWQALLDNGVIPQMQLAKQGTLTAFAEHASTITPALSREFGASAERFNATAGERLDTTRVMVDGKTSIIRTLIITAVILGIALLFFTDRYLVAMMVKPLGRIRQQFQRLRRAISAIPLKILGVTAWANWCRYCARCRTACVKPSVPSVQVVTTSGEGRRKFPPVITISPHVLKSRPRRWKRPLPAWSN
jgi:methyl-accepting chemotaxis protein